MKKILLVGGAGYIGTEVTNYFLRKKQKIICLDNFLYNNYKSIQEFKKNKNYQFVFGDLRDKKIINNLLDKVTDIVILAGLVGDPITKKYPALSENINFYGIKNLINLCKKKKISKLVFISTCSNYGIINNKTANEKSILNPQSLYAKQKIKIEKYLMGLKKNVSFSPTILRFATAFGVSKRERYDLTVNDFVLQALQKKKIKIFYPNTWRPYCHIKDFARIIYKVLFSKNSLTKFEIYNAGDNKNNYRKIDIIKKIKKYIPSLEYEIVYGQDDPRDYKVNFTKIMKKLSFKAKYNVDFGIKEVLRSIKKKQKINYLKNLGNYKIFIKA
jgi:nucleoside-diphosphate-sugar epimerase